MSRAGRAAEEASTRQLRREVQRIEQRTGGILVTRARIAEWQRVQRLFVALVKQQGRVRIADDELEALGEGDSVAAKVDGGTTTFSYVKAARPPQAEPHLEPAGEEPTP